MNEKTEFILIALVLVIAIIMLPISAAILTHGTDPYRIIEGNPVETAAEKAGLVVCSETPVTWNLAGAEGGKIYQISDNCANPTETVRIEVQKFDSAESRDAAILLFHSRTLGKAKPPGNMLIIGQYLVFVDSSGSSLFGSIAEELDKI
jgi:flagellar basal body-associated protein FliL